MSRLARRAEESLFGAVLLRPEALPGLRWVPPAAFSRPEHAVLWRVLHSIDFRDVPANDVPRVVSAAVERVEDPGLRACLTPARITEFVAQCPNARTGALYGGMTLDAATHRAVEESGQRLRQTAQTAEVDQADHALTDTEQVQKRLAALTSAWDRAPETVRNLLDTTPEEPVVVAERGARVRADVEAEAETVAGLLDWPEQIRDLRQLRPEDYSDPQMAAAYRAMRTLDERQSPIDTLTVAWEAQRRGEAVSEDLLATLGRTSVPSAAYSGEQVLATAALDRMDAAGHQLRNLARVALAPSGLIEHSATALQAVSDDRERLHAAHEIEPAAPETEPAPGAPSPADEMEIDV